MKLFSLVFFIKNRLRHTLEKRKNKLPIQLNSHTKISLIPSLWKVVKTYKSSIVPIITSIILLSGLMLLFWDIWLGWWSSNYLNLATRVTYFEFQVAMSIIIGIYILFQGYVSTRMLRKIG